MPPSLSSNSSQALPTFPQKYSMDNVRSKLEWSDVLHEQLFPL